MSKKSKYTSNRAQSGGLDLSINPPKKLRVLSHRRLAQRDFPLAQLKVELCSIGPFDGEHTFQGSTTSQLEDLAVPFDHVGHVVDLWTESIGNRLLLDLWMHPGQKLTGCCCQNEQEVAVRCSTSLPIPVAARIPGLFDTVDSEKLFLPTRKRAEMFQSMR